MGERNYYHLSWKYKNVCLSVAVTISTTRLLISRPTYTAMVIILIHKQQHPVNDNYYYAKDIERCPEGKGEEIGSENEQEGDELVFFFFIKR